MKSVEESWERTRLRSAARHAATRAINQRYKDEWLKQFEEELKKRGVA